MRTHGLDGGLLDLDEHDGDLLSHVRPSGLAQQQQQHAAAEAAEPDPPKIRVVVRKRPLNKKVSPLALGEGSARAGRRLQGGRALEVHGGPRGGEGGLRPRGTIPLPHRDGALAQGGHMYRT